MKHDDGFTHFISGFNLGRKTIWNLFNQKNRKDNCEKCKDKCRKRSCPRTQNSVQPNN